MRILKIDLTNYQGIKSLSIAPGGQSMDVYGDNETGKTTLANAITWALTGMPFEAVPGYSPKTIAGGEDMHNGEHSVELLCETDKGERFTAKKVYREEYINSRKRGVPEFKGNTTDYYIDGVPIAAKGYQDRIAALVGTPEEVQLLSRPDYFASAIHWTKRREILISVCGEVSDDEVIASDAELADMPERMAKPGGVGVYTVDELKAISKQSKSKAKEDKDRIGPRIDEARRTIDDSIVVPGDLADQIIEAKAEVERITASHARGSDDGSVALEFTKQIRELEARLEEARHDHDKAEREKNAKYYKQLQALEDEATALARDLRKATGDAKDLDADINQVSRRRTDLLEEYERIKAETWTGEEICPTCGQSLPAERIEEAKKAFNLRKSQRLEEVASKGQKVSVSVIDELKAKRIKALARVVELEKKVKDMVAAREEMEAKIVPPTSYEDGETLAKIEALKKQRREIEEGARQSNAAAEQSYQAALTAARSKQEALQAIQAQDETNRRQKARIAELEAEEVKLAEAYEYAERTIELCELFTTAKARMLDSRINERFKRVRFRIFRQQVNGGIEDTCEVMVPSQDGNLVPFASANNAGRINAGLEIIDVLGEAYGKRLPIIVDNAEGVTRLGETAAQTIRLIVSEADKQLRFVIKQ